MSLPFWLKKLEAAASQLEAAASQQKLPPTTHESTASAQANIERGTSEKSQPDQDTAGHNADGED